MVFGTVSYSGGLDLENGLLILGTAYKGVNVEEEIREIYYTTDLLTKELFHCWVHSGEGECGQSRKKVRM